MRDEGLRFSTNILKKNFISTGYFPHLIRIIYMAVTIMDSLDEKIVEKYFSGECTDAEMGQILQWLKASDDNRKEWLKLRMVPVKSNFVQLSDPEHVARSYRELEKEKNARKQFEHEITRKVTVRFMRYAASILVLVGMAYGSFRYLTWQKPQKMIVVAVSGSEPVRKIILDDSTRVWLSPGSQIEYPEKFDKKERKVSIEGKVYFEVAKDAKRLFYVKTDAFTVKVSGTSFEVNAYKFSQNSDVILVEGNVEIFDHALAPLCALKPGHQFEIDKLSKRVTLQQVEAEMYASWHGGKLEFDGLTFAEITKILERHYNVKIILGEGIEKDKELVGSLSFEKDIHQMMRALGLVLSIEYHVQTDTVVYIKAKN